MFHVKHSGLAVPYTAASASGICLLRVAKRGQLEERRDSNIGGDAPTL